MSNFRAEQVLTQQVMERIGSLIEQHADTKAVPQSWRGLRQILEDYHFTVSEDGIPLDGWGHPFLYSVKEGHPIITSYGRDGRPGGLGFDHDLSSDDKFLPRENAPTFVQFLLHRSARGVLLACLMCGVLSLLISLLTVNPPALQGWGILSLIIKLVLTTLAALFVAFILSILEIPNYH